MNTTREVANELRRVADALEQSPDLQISAYLSISPDRDDKETFLALAKIMPRPMKKKIAFAGTIYENYCLNHAFWSLRIPRKQMCILIEAAKPAVYDCPSILSEAEEAALGQV